MTIDDRVVIDLKDIAAIQFACGCGNVMSCPPGKLKLIHSEFACPNCGRNTMTKDTQPWKDVTNLVDALAALGAQEKPYKIRLEIRQAADPS